MKKLLGSALTLASLLSAPAALACGMPYGDEMGFDKNQNIVISHHNGIERYQFSPNFCGKSNEFGMILPVPNDLTYKPEVGDHKTYWTLADISAPTYINKPSKSACSNGFGGAESGGPPDTDGVQVVDAGTVGDFDYSVIKADTVQALLDWFDANKYPYDAEAKKGFEAYVAKGWRFVTFKITASEDKPVDGYSLCGSIQPIVLSFATEKPVIPTRIVTSGSANWTVYVISDKVVDGSANTTRAFSGPVGQEIADPNHPDQPIAKATDQLTRLSLSFLAAARPDDVVFSVSPNQDPFRATVTHEVCDPNAGEGGGAGGSSSGGASNGGGSSMGGKNSGGSSAGIPAGTGGNAPSSNDTNAGALEPAGGCSMGNYNSGVGLGFLAVGLAAWLERRRYRRTSRS